MLQRASKNKSLEGAKVGRWAVVVHSKAQGSAERKKTVRTYEHSSGQCHGWPVFS